MDNIVSVLPPKDRYSVTMLFLTAIVAIACYVLNDYVQVDAAHIVDVGERFRYSLYRDMSQAFRHPTLHSLLGLPKDVTLEVFDTFVTVHGVHRRRHRELYKGMEIIDTSIEADVNSAGHYDGGPVTGTIVLSLKSDLPDPATCALTKDEAQDIVFSGEGLPANVKIISKEFLEKIFVDSSKKAHLTYAVTIHVRESSKVESKPYYIIDRCDKSVLQKSQKVVIQSSTGSWETLQWNTGSTESWKSPTPKTIDASPVTGETTTKKPITTQKPPTPKPPSGECKTYVKGTGGNQKLGEIKYSEAPYRHCLDVTVNGNKCILENKYIKVVNLKHTEDTDKEDPVEFVCSEGFTDVTNGAYNPTLDAHYYGTAAFKVFEDWFGIYPLKTKPKMMVHYGTNYANAFWNGKVMAFGDGDESLYPLVSLDVVAHELSHGVTGQNSDLVYSGQSGGMNEAFSDMAGEAAEYYARGENDWKIGFYIFKAADQAMRYFDDPTEDGSSISDVKDFTDDMDVHHSSGVYNNVFYRVTKPGGIPIRYSFESFLIANKAYWTQNTNFKEGACGAVRGAYDGGLDTEVFVAAFKAVGIESCPLSSFLEPLTSAKTRSGIRVSTIRRPLFGIKTGSDAKKMIVTAVSTSGAQVKLELLRTISRANSGKTGTGRVEIQGEANTQYYVRLSTDSIDEIKDITLKLEMTA